MARELTERDKVRIRLVIQSVQPESTREQRIKVAEALLKEGFNVESLISICGISKATIRAARGRLIRKKVKFAPELSRPQREMLQKPPEEVPEVVKQSYKKPSEKGITNPFANNKREWNAKKPLTIDEVMYIVVLLEQGYSTRAIYDLTGVRYATVHKIQSGKHRYWPRCVNVTRKRSKKTYREVAAIPLTKNQWYAIVHTLIAAYVAGQEYTALYFPKGTCPPKWFCSRIVSLSDHKRGLDYVKWGGKATYKTKLLINKMKEVGVINFDTKDLESVQKVLDRIEKSLYN